MFCKKCGSNIKENVDFCPICGQKTGNFSQKMMVSSSSLPAMIQTTEAVSLQTRLKTILNAKGAKKLLAVGGIVVLLVLVLVIFRAGFGSRQTYSLVGTWESENVNIKNVLYGLLSGEGGLPDWMVDTMIEMVGEGELVDVSVTFSEDGGLWFGGNSFLINLGVFSYETVNNDTLLLKCTFDIPYVGDFSVSYRAKYTLKKDKLTLDLFGVKAQFKRQE